MQGEERGGALGVKPPVELRDRTPVGRGSALRARMNRRDRRLNRIRPVRIGVDCRFRMSEPFRNLRPIPTRTILLLEQHDFAALVDSRLTPRVMQHHHREKSARLRPGWPHPPQPTPPPNPPHALCHPDQLPGGVIEAALLAYSIDRFVSRDANNPRARILRQPVAMPLFDRARERVLRRVFRQVEIAEHANERGEYSPELLAIETLDTGGSVIHRQTRKAKSVR